MTAPTKAFTLFMFSPTSDMAATATAAATAATDATAAAAAAATTTPSCAPLDATALAESSKFESASGFGLGPVAGGCGDGCTLEDMSAVEREFLSLELPPAPPGAMDEFLPSADPHYELSLLLGLDTMDYGGDFPTA
jgi:hypothetical protein